MLKFRRHRKLKYKKIFDKSFCRNFHKFAESRSQKRKKVQKLLLITIIRNIHSNSYWCCCYWNQVLFQKQLSRDLLKNCVIKILHNSHENNCTAVSFLIKLQAEDLIDQLSHRFSKTLALLKYPGCTKFRLLCSKKHNQFKGIRTLPNIYAMFCTIWHHLYNFKNVKNTHGEVLHLVKLY